METVTRDTCPDLTLTKNVKHADWLNTEETLGSDHCIVITTIRTHPLTRPHHQAKLPDWTKFRLVYSNPTLIAHQGYYTWSQHLVNSLHKIEQTVQLSEATPAVDNHLLHLWEARHSLVRRWRRQKHNRQLKIRIAALTLEADEYAAQLADSNWVERCNTAATQMSSRNTWRLFRALIDPSQTRTETQKHLQRALHAYAGDAEKLAQALRDKYLCSQQDPIGPAYSYAGTENAELDRCFQLHHLKAALSIMKRGTAPGRDRVTVRLLANLPDSAYIHLLDYFNQIWEGREPLPLDWKTALVTFIPKSGKSVNIDNLRPISLTSCVGKLMEAMVRDRLSEYLEARHTFADTMYGFRPHRSAQDILLQLHRDVVEPVEHPSDDKVVLALDLKGAFDNVTHDIILTNLSQTNCGHNAFRYVRQFLIERQTYLRIQDKEHGPYPFGTRGTPQGAVLSPLLFNLAMAHLPSLLNDVPGVQHALYADDITLWATQGSLGSIETCLQHAASIVDSYARGCGLECSPTKSEYVHLRPKPNDTTQIELTLCNRAIPERDEIRVLGLFIHKHRKIDTTLRKLRTVGDQVGRMIRRVSNKRGGLKSRAALRLANAFVTSRILYSTPYLRLRKCDENTLDCILRKIYKRALDLPISTSNQRLADLGMTNTYGELKEAHLNNQYLRLSRSQDGNNLLHYTASTFPTPTRWKSVPRSPRIGVVH